MINNIYIQFRLRYHAEHQMKKKKDRQQVPGDLP